MYAPLVDLLVVQLARHTDTVLMSDYARDFEVAEVDTKGLQAVHKMGGVASVRKHVLLEKI